jgi:flagellar biosynthetic protein FliP
MLNTKHLKNISISLSLALAGLFVSGLVSPGFAQNIIGQLSSGMPAVNMVSQGDGSTTYSLSLQILALMSAITVLPSLVLGMTSFTRIIIVLSILRQALGTQSTPPNQVLVAIALFISMFIMTPTLTAVYEDAVTPYMSGDYSAETAIGQGTSIMKGFMIRNTRERELTMFADLAGDVAYETNDDVPLTVLLPAFITSELKTAFQIGFLIFLPFLVIDMVIASILMSLGMMMLSPMLVALPFKLLLFVLVDGWAMTVGSLVATYSAN